MEEYYGLNYIKKEFCEALTLYDRALFYSDGLGLGKLEGEDGEDPRYLLSELLKNFGGTDNEYNLELFLDELKNTPSDFFKHSYAEFLSDLENAKKSLLGEDLQNQKLLWNDFLTKINAWINTIYIEISDILNARLLRLIDEHDVLLRNAIESKQIFATDQDPRHALVGRLVVNKRNDSLRSLVEGQIDADRSNRRWRSFEESWLIFRERSLLYTNEIEYVSGRIDELQHLLNENKSHRSTQRALWFAAIGLSLSAFAIFQQSKSSNQPIRINTDDMTKISEIASQRESTDTYETLRQILGILDTISNSSAEILKGQTHALNSLKDARESIETMISELAPSDEKATVKALGDINDSLVVIRSDIRLPEKPNAEALSEQIEQLSTQISELIEEVQSQPTPEIHLQFKDTPQPEPKKGFWGLFH